MADEKRIGKPWSSTELDEIVGDYFEMLSADLAGSKNIKSRHAAALMERIGRTHKSVEFKHQNISAVLDELGLPWIPGYIPKRNYQSAIFDAIDRYLSLYPAILSISPTPPPVKEHEAAIFVEPPSPTDRAQPVPPRLQALVRKFDPVERDRRNRSLGRAGEEYVLEFERRRLFDLGRTDLTKRIRWVASEDGDGAGYDIASFAATGSTMLIEVKTTNGAARTPFYLSRNECEIAILRPDEWTLYRVHLFARTPRIFMLHPPLDSAVNLTPETWRASF